MHLGAGYDDGCIWRAVTLYHDLQIKRWCRELHNMVIPVQTHRAQLGRQRHCTDPECKLAESSLNLATLSLECSKVHIKVQRKV